jgi:putative holliday junction resolvase
VSRVLAVDPGEVRLGVAVSDPGGTIARPLTVIRHSARARDAQAIADLALENAAQSIVIGLALDADGRVGPQARRALRLVEALREITDLPIETFDETGTTQAAAGLGSPSTPLDARAAAVLLQEYLDARKPT